MKRGRESLGWIADKRGSQAGLGVGGGKGLLDELSSLAVATLERCQVLGPTLSRVLDGWRVLISASGSAGDGQGGWGR
jgi:hypothetical protein